MKENVLAVSLVELQNTGTLVADDDGKLSGEPADPQLVKHLFRYNYAYKEYACGGSPLVVNKVLKAPVRNRRFL